MSQRLKRAANKSQVLIGFDKLSNPMENLPLEIRKLNFKKIKQPLQGHTLGNE